MNITTNVEILDNLCWIFSHIMSTSDEWRDYIATYYSDIFKKVTEIVKILIITFKFRVGFGG